MLLKTFVIKTGIFFLNIVYSFLKLLPVEKKLVYISRQSNSVSVDFNLIKSTMESKLPDYKNIVLVRTIDSGISAKIQYFFHMLRQMYHLATAKVVILDSYCIAVSVLKQRDSLLVVQIWHALGALKKFGYSILDKGEGSSSKIASLMKMHRNYSYVFTSGEICRPYFAEAFNQPLEKIRVFPLPRLDLLVNKEYQEKKKQEILSKYPFLLNDKKKIIVYAPTFRKNEKIFQKGVEQLLNVIDYNKFNLLFKPHPLSSIEGIEINKHVIGDRFFSTEDALYLADYVITDYSAIIFEGLALQKQLILYAFDFDMYIQERDFYLDYQKLFLKYIANTPNDVIEFLQGNQKEKAVMNELLNQMVADPHISYTNDICNFIIRCGILKEGIKIYEE